MSKKKTDKKPLAKRKSVSDAGLAKQQRELSKVLARRKLSPDETQKFIEVLKKKVPRELLSKVMATGYSDTQAGVILGRLTKMPADLRADIGCHLVDQTVKALNPRDPLERMLIEQMMFCYERVAQLSSMAALQTPIATMLAIHDQCDKAMTAYRRSMLAPKQYRNGSGSKLTLRQVNQAEQQNVMFSANAPEKKT